jgi:hypothetical protein
MSRICKLNRWSATSLEGYTHTGVAPEGRFVESDLIRVDHYQRPGHSQSYVLSILEYAILHDDARRTRLYLFYLAREFYYRRQFARTLILFDLYLQEATHEKGIARAHTYMARCYWGGNPGRIDEARASCLKAIALNPEDKQALELMAEMCPEPQKHKWAHHAACATDEDILF